MTQKKSIKYSCAILGALIGTGAVFIGFRNEISGFYLGTLGALWIGPFALAIDDAGGISDAAKAIVSSLAGFMMILFFFSILAVGFGLVIFLLDNPITKDLTFMTGSLADLTIAPLIPVVLGALAWIAKKLSWLDEDVLAIGIMGLMAAVVPLFFIGGLGLGIYLLLPSIVNSHPIIPFIYTAVFGTLHGLAVYKFAKSDLIGG